MGGGGSYYDRDTSDGYTRGSSGYSPAAAEQVSKKKLDAGMLPLNRRLASSALSPIVFEFDVTGSVGNLPLIIFDKAPMVCGQLAQLGYLKKPEISIGAVGDITWDDAPLQMGDFSDPRKLDDWFKRVFVEKGGGSGGEESYEFALYYYAYLCDIPKAQTPFFLLTCDEGFRETLYKSDLERHFGGTHETVTVQQVYKDLKKKFKDNVFIIRKLYGGRADGPNVQMAEQWERLVGKNHIVTLGSDESIADVTLGIFAVRSGARTLDEYCDDMVKARNVPQTPERIAEVRKSLATVAELGPMKLTGKRTKRTTAGGTDAGGAPKGGSGRTTGSKKSRKFGRV